MNSQVRQRERSSEHVGDMLVTSKKVLASDHVVRFAESSIPSQNLSPANPLVPFEPEALIDPLVPAVCIEEMGGREGGESSAMKAGKAGEGGGRKHVFQEPISVGTVWRRQVGRLVAYLKASTTVLNCSISSSTAG
jgi:hypothetical protein